VANCFLAHLSTRGFSPGTIRGYAFDLLNFSRFLAGRDASLADVVPTDLFDYLDWQAKFRRQGGPRE
jgi:site-specific recombinase XerD